MKKQHILKDRSSNENASFFGEKKNKMKENKGIKIKNQFSLNNVLCILIQIIMKGGNFFLKSIHFSTCCCRYNTPKKRESRNLLRSFLFAMQSATGTVMAGPLLFVQIAMQEICRTSDLASHLIAPGTG